MNTLFKTLPELQEVSNKLEIIEVKHPITDYVPAYPLTNKLRFFRCHIYNVAEKKMFRLNLRQKNIINKISRLNGTIEHHQTVIYICKDHFIAYFSQHKKLIEDYDNNRFDNYEFMKD